MSENKRYYWLQLKKDFFKTRAMKKLRSIAGGDTYTIIYLKMQLLSLENGGYLFHEGVEENMLEEIALDIDESYDNVNITFQFLVKCNLIEAKEDQMFLPEVTENIGSETPSAQRQRRFRASKEQKPLLSNNDVQNSNTTVQSGNVELEKEKEKEKEINTKINKEGNKSPSRAKFIKPTIDELQEYCKEKSYAVDCESFLLHYESNGWLVGKNKMKSWKAALGTWSKNSYGKQTEKKQEKTAEERLEERRAEVRRRMAESKRMMEA